MMITNDPIEFKPFGSRLISICGKNDPENASESTISKENSEEKKSVLRIRKSNNDGIYEELYACGTTAVWSCNRNQLLKSFSTDFNIIDAFWHPFANHNTNADPDNEIKWDAICIVGKRSMDIYRLEDGERFQVALPFAVNHVYPTQFGLLLQRFPTTEELRSSRRITDQRFPFLFSLSHPLNEIVPVIYKPKNANGEEMVRYTTDLTLNAVYSDLQFSLLLTFDTKTGCHALWIMNKASKQDAAAASEYLQNTILSTASRSGAVSQTSLNTTRPTLSLTPFTRSGAVTFGLTPPLSQSAAGPSSSSGQQTTSLQQTTTTTTATTSLSSGLLSNLFAGAQSSTPAGVFNFPSTTIVARDIRSPASLPARSLADRILPPPSMALTPRVPSRAGGQITNPAVAKIIRMNLSGSVSGSSLLSTPRSVLAMTPKGEVYHSYYPSPALNSYHAGDYLHPHSYCQSAVPFVPDLCMELFWTESVTQSRSDYHTLIKSGERAAKVVVVRDFAGGIFLCYLIRSLGQLRCLKILPGKDGGHIGFSGVIVLDCRDVAVFADSKFMLVQDPEYHLHLYSGVRKISSLFCDAISLLSPPEKYADGQQSSQTSRILSSSELMASDTKRSFRRPGETMRDMVESIFSPVQGDGMDINEPVASGAVFNGTVDTFCEYSPCFLLTVGSTARISLCSIPPLKASIEVQLCLDALRIVLPEQIFMDIRSSWYLSSQMKSPSCGPDCPEIVVFLKFLMDATGFPSLPMFEKYGLANDSMAEIPAKRSKCSEDGSDSDWMYLVQNLKTNLIDGQFQVGFEHLGATDIPNEPDEQLVVRSGAAYFTLLPTIFYSMHCCYEELKLNQLHWPILRSFGECMMAMARALELHAYIDHYFRDWCNDMDEKVVAIDARDKQRLRFPEFWTAECFSIHRYVYRVLKNTKDADPVPLIQCCDRLWSTIIVYRIFSGHARYSSDVAKFVTAIGERTQMQKDMLTIMDMPRCDDIPNVLARLLKRIKASGGGSCDVLDTFPPGIMLPLLLRLTPPQFRIIQDDSNAKKKMGHSPSTNSTNQQHTSCREKAAAKLKSDEADGMAGQFLNDDLSKLLFPKDVRLFDVRHMLRSSKQCKISLKQRPGVADNEFREEQERYLYSVCVRTMALPIGRGMFTLRSHRPLLAENVDIPKLCLTGRTAGPHSLTIDLSHIEVPANMDLWAKFHNGVAAGLRLAPPSDVADQQLDTSWIIYNMPRSTPPGTANDGSNNNSVSLTPEHAGFLFGLGLNGHLTNLALFNLHEYLVKGDSMTSIALLLGMAAAKCRTAELQAMKMLSTHLPFLLLPTLLELNIDPSVQTAAVMGVGLLYAESGNYRLAEALVKEIGRPATASNDNFADRESYSLTCGFALGMITLGLGDMVFGDPNFTLASELCLLMNGGHKRSHHYVTDSPPSQLVKDGDFLNVHMSSAPAIVALGLMYLRSNNHQVAAWFDPPETLALLDTVRPDFLMLRTVSKSLILWNDIIPNVDWVESHVPAVVARFVDMADDDRLMAIREQFVDLETVAQAYCNIVTGACFAMALKFAGSANADAFKCLIHYFKLFDASYQQSNPPTWRKIYNKAGRYTIETSLNVIVMALGAVMAGTGNLDVLRIVRHLRQRIGPHASNWLLHGGHMAAHMALGLLFLGGGRHTLSTSNLSVAVLFCALYPKFPITSNDNRFHLQAFRHLYVLACDQRLLVTRDYLTSEIDYCNISVKFKACQHYKATTECLRTPCILPELNLLEELRVNDERYWPMRFATWHEWEQLRRALQSNAGLDICRRAGFCCKKDDSLGYQSIVASFRMNSDDWVPLLQQLPFDETLEILQSLKLWCAKRDCEFAYSRLVNLFHMITAMPLQTIHVWQLRLLLANAPRLSANNKSASTDENVGSVEFLTAWEMKLRHHLTEGVNANSLKAYIDHRDDSSGDISKTNQPTLLGEFLTFFGIPGPKFWSRMRLRDYRSLRLFLEKFISMNMPITTALVLHRVLSRSS